MSYYGDLCTQIYDLDKPKPPENEFEFYLNYMKKGDKVLEPMCGTGRFLVAFLEKGFNVDGFDNSEDMLNACKRKVESKGMHCNLIHTKADEFNTEEKYDLIITPGGSFVVIKEKQELIESLKNIYNCLKEDGKFIIEIFTPVLKVKNNDEWLETNRKKRSDGKEIVQYSKSYYDQKNQLISYPLKYELANEAHIIQSEEMILYIKLHKINEFKAILEQVGFKILKVFNGHSKEIASEDSKLVIFECSK